MNRKWLYALIPVFLALAGAAILIFGRGAPGADMNIAEDTVVITVDGAEYARVPLSKPETVTIEQENGEVNVIEISERGAVMAFSNCRNQLCVKMGEVTVDNWEIRPNQAFIVCLPNRITVELVVAQ